MELLFILTQIHLVSLIVCAIVLRLNLPKSVQAVIEKNSRRMDGSVSPRRNQIELVSIRHAFVRVYVGLVVLFVGTSMAGLLTAGLALPLPTFDENQDPMPIGAKLDPSNESPPSKLPWPLVAVYLVSTFIVAPQLISSLYRSAINRYLAHGNMRFREYWRSEWLSMKKSESKKESAMKKSGPQKQPTI